MAIRPCIPFPSPPLKFRTAGFPQYGFKPVVGGNLRPRAGLYAAQASSALAHNSPSGNRRTASASRRDPSKRTGPEALGSASGCSVPSRHRLLWPHPRLWASPAGLSFPPAGLCRSRDPEIPQFKLHVFRSVPSPIPRRARWPSTVVLPPVVAFASL